jgi:hypothetical protein
VLKTRALLRIMKNAVVELADEAVRGELAQLSHRPRKLLNEFLAAQYHLNYHGDTHDVIDGSSLCRQLNEIMQEK